MGTTSRPDSPIARFRDDHSVGRQVGRRTAIASRRLRLQLIGPWPPGRWHGPALRGLIAGTVKRALCVWDNQIREQLYERCDGCSHQDTCQYGRWFEPLEKPVPVVGSSRDPHAACVIPEFVSTNNPRFRHSDEINVRLLFLDTSEQDQLFFLEQLKAISRRRTPGRDGLSFRVIHDDLDGGVNAEIDFWDSWNAIMQVPLDHAVSKVSFHAATPLMLKRNGKPRLRPELFDLTAASLRMLRRLLLMFDEAAASRSAELSSEDVKVWKQIAAARSADKQYWRTIVTPHHSFRQQTSYEITACHGFSTYRDVPLRLVRMIELAGHLGIGARRVCGAGQVIVKPG